MRNWHIFSLGVKSFIKRSHFYFLINIPHMPTNAIKILHDKNQYHSRSWLRIKLWICSLKLDFQLIAHITEMPQHVHSKHTVCCFLCTACSSFIRSTPGIRTVHMHSTVSFRHGNSQLMWIWRIMASFFNVFMNF
jgi:hypothetical protein